MKKDNGYIDLHGVVSNPIRGEDGKPLSDLDLVKQGLEKIKEYKEQNKELPPINPKFVTFMEEMVEDVEAGNSTVEQYKNMHIVKEYMDKIDFSKKGDN